MPTGSRPACRHPEVFAAPCHAASAVNGPAPNTAGQKPKQCQATARLHQPEPGIGLALLLASSRYCSVGPRSANHPGRRGVQLGGDPQRYGTAPAKALPTPGPRRPPRALRALSPAAQRGHTDERRKIHLCGTEEEAADGGNHVEVGKLHRVVGMRRSMPASPESAWERR